jgi:hypothetical protein
LPPRPAGETRLEIAPPTRRRAHLMNVVSREILAQEILASPEPLGR